MENRELKSADLAVNLPAEPVEGSAEVSVVGGDYAACEGLDGELVQMELARPGQAPVPAENAGDFQAEIVEMTLIGDPAEHANVERVIAENGNDGSFSPADSFFDVFVEIDLPGVSGGDGPMPQSIGADRPSDGGGLQPDFFFEDPWEDLLEDLIDDWD